jgi:hypothetical protein
MYMRPPSRRRSWLIPPPANNNRLYRSSLIVVVSGYEARAVPTQRRTRVALRRFVAE